MAQSEVGKIRIFEDFTGLEVAVGGTTAPPINFGQYFQLVGQGLAETDSGAVAQAGLSGVVRFTTTDEDVHCLGLQTDTMFDIGKMAPLVMEVRVQLPSLATEEVFIGFSDVQTDLAIIEAAIMHGATTTLTLTASDLVGFFLADELTDDEGWHMPYNGGTTTGPTVSTSVASGVDAVVGDYNILRLEIDPNGTARWYIDGVLKQTVAGAVSTTTDLCFNCLVESKTTATKSMDVDYILITGNRDWTI